MLVPDNKKYFTVSVILHGVILLALVLGLDATSTLPVFENTNKNDVISAVVLGDSAKSKILPRELTPQPEPAPPKELPKPQEQKSLPPPVKVDDDAIAIKQAKKKKLAEEKAQALKKQRDMFARSLLDDIKKTKKLKQKALAKQFQNTLRQQAEQSLRQQLLNEEIKLQGVQSRQSQGEVNKYKALILQTISEHWIIPSQANKSLYCELMIRLAPGGMVMDVQIIRTSGDPSLDSSARAAVLKASPLPVPPDSAAFEPFRQFVLKVKPENVVSGDGILGTF